LREGVVPEDDIKKRVLEFAAIAKECPENLQTKCFELLLSDYLTRRTEPPQDEAAVPATPQAAVVQNNDTSKSEADDLVPEDTTAGQQDIRLGDVHIKTRKFLEKHALKLDDLNALFYKEGGEFKPLYEDIKTTRMSEGQVRITLLQALVAGMTNGEFEADGEAVRSECKTRKCYDSANFAANFARSSNLFDGFTKYEKDGRLKLSDDGRKELAELIKELAK
jgi:hypothetical protein